MKNEELAKLKIKSNYDDGMNEWAIPVFLLKNREVTLPSVSIKKQSQDFMENQKNERVLVFEDEEREQSASVLSSNNNKFRNSVNASNELNMQQSNRT